MDGGWWDRLRRVDPRIWDMLLALGAVVLGVLAFALRAQRPDEPPAALGFALVVVAGSSLADLTGVGCARVGHPQAGWLRAFR